MSTADTRPNARKHPVQPLKPDDYDFLASLEALYQRIRAEEAAGARATTKGTTP